MTVLGGLGSKGRLRITNGRFFQLLTTTKVATLIPAYGNVYKIQHCVIKFVSDLWQVGGSLRVLRFPPPIKRRNM
jgi:hypothetical protein